VGSKDERVKRGVFWLASESLGLRDQVQRKLIARKKDPESSSIFTRVLHYPFFSITASHLHLQRINLPYLIQLSIMSNPDWYQPSRNRVCLVTFVNEKDLPKGQKLKTCSKCKEACYISREAQLDHWPTHKLVCCAIENDSPIIKRGIPNLKACVTLLGGFFCGHFPLRVGESRLLTHALQQLKRWYEDEDPDIVFTAHEEMLQDIARYIFLELDKVAQDFNMDAVALWWAVPGFANYMLSDEIMLSRLMKERKDKGEDVLTKAESEDKDIFAISTGSDILKAAKKHPGMFLPLSFCAIVNQIHSTTAAVSVMKERSGDLPLQRAIIRRVMRNWNCPYWRASYVPLPVSTRGEGFWTVRNEFILNMLRASQVNTSFYKRSLEDGEVVPGLTMKQLFTVIVNDYSFLSSLDTPKSSLSVFEYFMNIFGEELERNEDGTRAMASVSAEDRLDLLEIFFKRWGKLAPLLGPQNPESFASLFKYLALGGNRSNVLLRLHDKMKTRQESTSEGVKELLEANYSTIVQEVTPQVMAFVDIFEGRYQRKMRILKEEPQPFPEDLIKLISEYALPSEVVLEANLERLEGDLRKRILSNDGDDEEE
jgi:hypothetical protein